MNYNFNDIEKKWQDYWAKNQTFKANNNSDQPKYYVLDMFPYPSGAGLHVGHPLGYIASDIYARYKRHKGFNVLHPQGYDSFGLPAEQYAIQTGQHPAITTETNIKTYRRQLDQIGFSFDWSREVRTSNPEYYKWTQWIFIQLFESWYNKETDQAEPISTLISKFSSEGNSKVNAACDEGIEAFTAEDWKNFSSEKQQELLLKYRLTYLAETEVNWCPALGTVLANDEIVNGVSERGGHPVVRKKMTQWSMRISAYAERLLQGLDTIDWTDSLKESQRNWIGKSVGAIVRFPILSFPEGKEKAGSKVPGYMTGGNHAHLLIERAKEMRANPTEAEAVLWSQLRGKALGAKFRQQHLIEDFIADFVCLDKKLIIEVDGKIHDSQIEKDTERSNILENLGYKVIRFKNEEVLGDIDAVLDQIAKELAQRVSLKDLPETESGHSEQVLPLGKDLGWEIDVFTTRPDTIFGVSFMTLAPEHELVSKITTEAQKTEVEAYIEQTAKRSERDRMADVKTISGVFTGAYAEHPFTKEAIPIWIGDYVLAGYGTGAVMAVPCGDQRDYDFAKHFNIPIPNIFSPLTPKEGTPSSENLIETEAFTEKSGFIIKNSDFLNGLNYKEASKKAILELENIGQGEGKTNYRLRDAVFSRQRYWGEPFPVYYVNGMPQMIDAKHLPLTLPEVEKYLPTEEGEPPLGRATHWAWDTKNNVVVSNEMLKEAKNNSNDNDDVTLSAVEGSDNGVYPLELNTMPGWAGSSWYFFRYMEPGLSAGRESMRDETFASKDALNYWENVDLYIGGSEHATGHLLYARFWTKFLKDRGFVGVDEPFKKLINQGMILGTSAFAYIYDGGFASKSGNSERDSSKILIISKDALHFIRKYIDLFHDLWKKAPQSDEEIIKKYSINKEILSKIKSFYNELLQASNKLDYLSIDWLRGAFPVRSVHVDVSLINSSDELDIKDLIKWRPEYKKAQIILDDGVYKVGRDVEKMSKSKYNVVNPDEICEQYGADSLRLYEMFLGPLEQYKPWNTAGITGVHNFLKKLWKLYHTGENESFRVDSSPLGKPDGASPLGNLDGASPMGKPDEALKTLHKTIKKVEEDIENFSFNTSVSTFMIAVNELSAQKCTSKEILEPLLILISPYAPHIAEELWEKLGHKTSITTAAFPKYEEKYLVESSKNYPISFNGKMRFTLELPLDMTKEEIEKTVMAHEKTQAQLEGRTPKKIIVVPGKIVNIVG